MSAYEGVQSEEDINMDHYYYEVLGDLPKNTIQVNIRNELVPEKYDTYFHDLLSLDKNLMEKSFQTKLHHKCEHDNLCWTNVKKNEQSGKDQLLSQRKEIKKQRIQKNEQNNIQISVNDKKIFPPTAPSERKQKKLKKFIMKEVSVKKSTTKFAISKFLIRIFLANEKLYTKSQTVSKYNQILYKELRNQKKGKFTIQTGLLKIFGLNHPQEDIEAGKTNRRIMANILNDHLKQQIIMNPFTQKNRLSYMIGSKVYALRTRSKELVKKASFR